MKQLVRLDNWEVSAQEVRYFERWKAVTRPLPIGLNPTASRRAVATYRRRARRAMRKEP